MAALALEQLPAPQKGYRPMHDTRRADGKIGFPKPADSSREDRNRAKFLRKAHRDHPDLFDDCALDLAKRLEKGVETKVPPRSLASAVYTDQLRNRLDGNIWPLVEDEEHHPVVTATLVPAGL